MATKKHRRKIRDSGKPSDVSRREAAEAARRIKENDTSDETDDDVALKDMWAPELRHSKKE